jgi:hypothetical protein
LAAGHAVLNGLKIDTWQIAAAHEPIEGASMSISIKRMAGLTVELMQR